MTLSRPPPWFWIGLLLTATVTAAGVLLVAREPMAELIDIDTVQKFVTVVVAGASFAGWLWRQARRTGAAQWPLERAANELAEQLRRQWEQAERRLTRPALPVQWRWARWPVTGPKAEAVGGPDGRLFEPLPGMAAVTAEQLSSGTRKDLFDVYGGLGSGRLIVLGEPGTGKSSAGILLLCKALAHRATVTAGDRAPVPVLVTARDWDPNAERLTEWLAGSLAREYPLLRAPEYGEDVAMRLIQGGHLAVILDGLDEMPEGWRPEALRALNEQATFRLVVLVGTQELVAAVSGGTHLWGAAALELLPIDPQQAAEYLASALTDPLPDPWQRVVDHLRKQKQEHPKSVLAQALEAPLMLTLVRDTYGPGERVDELIDDPRLAAREAVEDHLLDRVLTAAYAEHPGRPIPPYTLGQARRWLGQLARRMNEDETRDLAWWRIPCWVPVWPRVMVTVGLMCLVSAFLVWCLGSLAHLHLLIAFQAGSLTALAAAFTRGLGYAFMFGFGSLLVSPPGGGSPPQQESLRWSRTDIRMILLLGAGVGAGTGLQNGLWGGELKYGLATGLVSSVVVGLGFVLGGGPPQRLGWLRWDRTDTRTNLRTGLVVGIGAGLVAGIGYGLGYGLKPGLEYGFLVGIGYLLVILVGGRTSPQHSQLRWNRTTTPATLLIGLIITTVSTGGYGIIYVLLVLLGGRPSPQRSQLRWSRTTTPTTLLIGLVAGPILWLWNLLTTPASKVWPFYLALGLGFGLTAGLLVGSRPLMEATSALDPQSLWHRERQSGLMAGLVVGLVVGLVYGIGYGIIYWLWFGLTAGIGYGITNGLADGLMVGLGSALVSSATWTAMLTSAQLQHRDKAPARLLPFLDDARQRQVLHTVGPVYQFRNARLQNRLAQAENTPQRVPVSPGYATRRG